MKRTADQSEEITVETDVVLPENAKEGGGCWGTVAAILRPPCGEAMALVELSRVKERRRLKKDSTWAPYPVTVPLRTLRKRTRGLRGLPYKEKADHRIPRAGNWR